MLQRRTAELPWDALDEQSCAPVGEPDWSTPIVVGPTKRRGARGQVALEWTVTVHCRPHP